MNAYNIWHFLLSGELYNMPDSKTFKGISYISWGLFMFFAASSIALFPLAKYGYLSIVRRAELNIPLDKFLIMCTVIPSYFFISIRKCTKDIPTLHLFFNCIRYIQKKAFNCYHWVFGLFFKSRKSSKIYAS